MKKTVIMMMAALVLTMMGCKKEQPLTAVEFAQTMGMGWNLGNNMDAHKDGIACEDGFANKPASPAVFETVAKAGFKSVRIPCTWMGLIGDAPTYTIDPERLDRVAELVEAAHAQGLKVIINIHHDGFGADPNKNPCYWLDIEGAAADELKNKAIQNKLKAVWKQIANRFADADEWLIFETMNEIQDGAWGNGRNRTDGGQQYRVLNEWNQACVDAIRATGGKNATIRYIGVPGYVCSPHLTIEYMKLPKDVVEGKLMVAVHSYDPWDYAGSGKYSEWGHTGKDVVPGNQDEMTYLGMLEVLYHAYVEKGVPVYFGEWGCVHRDNEQAEAFRKYYIEFVAKAMRSYQMTGLWWDNSYDMEGDDAFGLIEHSTGKYIANGEEICKLMIDAWENNDPAYTIESIMERAPQAK